MSREPKLLEPLSTVVGGVLRVLIGLISLAFVLSLFTDVRVGWGTGDGCVTADWMGGNSSDTPTLFPAREGAQVGVIPEFCAADMNGYQSVLNVLSELPSALLVVGGLLLLNRLLKAAARDGVYTLQTAARVRLLGWWLLAGSVVAEVVQANAQAALLATLAKEAPYTAVSWLNTWTPPYLAVLTGLGLLTFSRIMRLGAAMREDIEGTV
ncbi:hypothetical protein [Streptomyces sp. NPDC002187]|uniref:hypothetical protein n=1 Tax=Streptomyces sp. NPDC002187 TaxID=3364637 RepID=UPI00369C31D5